MPKSQGRHRSLRHRQGGARDQAGKVEFRVEKAGIVHVAIGKRSFGAERLLENAQALLTSLLRAKPASAKGHYMQSVAVSTTMGPGIAASTRDRARPAREDGSMRRAEKIDAVRELQDDSGRATVAVLAEYRGLTVGQHEPHSGARVREAQGRCRVGKNTLAKRRRSRRRVTRSSGRCSRPAGADPRLQRTRSRSRSWRSSSPRSSPSSRSGARCSMVLVLPAAEVKALATLPAREVLLAQLLGLLQAPATQLLRTLNEPAARVARLVDSIGKRAGSGAGEGKRGLVGGVQTTASAGRKGNAMDVTREQVKDFLKNMSLWTPRRS